MSTLVLYHKSCPDGFCAAWVARLALGDEPEYLPINYGEPVPDVTDKDVYVLDFSFKRPIMEEMKSKAKSILVLDHHKTAQDELKGLDYCVFDMTKSGARLTWEHFFGTNYVPYIVLFTEDRDLWNWAIPQSREVNSAISLLPYEFEAWDREFGVVCEGKLCVNPNLDIDALAIIGRAVEEYKATVVKSAIKHYERVTILDYDVPCVNATTLQSEIGNKLSEGEHFSATWFYDAQAHKYRYSLRSQPEGVDVSMIAKRMGGGGHPRAAGFESDKKI